VPKLRPFQNRFSIVSLSLLHLGTELPVEMERMGERDWAIIQVYISHKINRNPPTLPSTIPTTVPGLGPEFMLPYVAGIITSFVCLLMNCSNRVGVFRAAASARLVTVLRRDRAVAGDEDGIGAIVAHTVVARVARWRRDATATCVLSLSLMSPRVD
jgi:hypothetical protein